MSAAKIAEIWLTPDKARALLDVSERSLRMQSDAGKITARTSESRAPNGKKPREYLLSSFPADIQAKFAREQQNSVAITPFAGSTLPLFAASPEVAEPVRLQLDEEDRKEADRWLEAIAQFNDLKQCAKDGKP